MYASLRSFMFNAIPGYCVSDLVYLGAIVFIIAGIFAAKKWTPFISVLIFAVVFKLLDFLVLGQNATILIQQFLHIIALPFVFTLIYKRR